MAIKRQRATKEMRVLNKESEIKIGDTVIHNGDLRTVGKETFGKDELMGLTLWGDSYALGYRKVEVVESFK